MGDHVPVIPFVEVAGKVGAGDPLQMAAMALNVGVTVAITVMSIVVEAVAHWPILGENVYVVVPEAAVLTVDGLHVPLIPLLEVAGNVGAEEFIQSGPTCVNTGLICVAIVTFIVAFVAH